MSGLDVFVLIVVPAIAVVTSCGGLWVQARANRAIQTHVDRLDEINAAEAASLPRLVPDTSEHFDMRPGRLYFVTTAINADTQSTDAPLFRWAEGVPHSST